MEKKMKTYPYIGEGIESNNIVLFSSDKYGMCLKGLTCATGTSGAWCERAFKNITHEYLDNTYGEVVSPEHAEFIVELAELHGIKRAFTSPMKTINAFAFKGGNLYLYGLVLDELTQLPTRKITIPLPPKADKQESSEWPQVGDEVFWSNGCYSGVVKARHWNDLWVMESCGEFSTLYIDDVKKPKTPEEKLRDDIQSIIFKRHAEMVTSIHVKNSLIAMSNSATEILLDEFEIKRKPQ